MAETTVLLLATFGLEVVECGGALALNARRGGVSHAAVLLCREEMRPQVREAAELLGVEVEFLDFAYGHVAPDVPSKKRIIQVIRRVKPDIVITQDPEHCVTDLDPDRRQAMILYLEAIALASRDFAVEELGLPPHPISTIYYMMPAHPNCVVDISPVWELKERALEKLEVQLRFTASVLKGRLSQDALRRLLPGVDPADDLAVGRALHREMDRAVSLYHGLAGHGSRAALAEPYRREGPFTLDRLTA
ncbi:GlcNAc-PI de-N-acetylase [Candidatus Bipolaricaulota bacterium]|nr:GlcNAc-PI de-N-acetylase [Candidatus Bipolaricaulota bacterium]